MRVQCPADAQHCAEKRGIFVRRYLNPRQRSPEGELGEDKETERKQKKNGSSSTPSKTRRHCYRAAAT